jgi:hypothetical protein
MAYHMYFSTDLDPLEMVVAAAALLDALHQIALAEISLTMHEVVHAGVGPQ